MSTPRERVARGAALLDERVPGWERAVNLDYLAMQSKCHCVIGQLLGDYTLGRRRMELSPQDGIDLGFDGDSEGDYSKLQAEWRSLIESRRAK